MTDHAASARVYADALRLSALRCDARSDSGRSSKWHTHLKRVHRFTWSAALLPGQLVSSRLECGHGGRHVRPESPQRSAIG
jgi:hypothetical protein